ncbi:MAG: tRNA uridine-5-carboxymethylaminomethyl(34) synthesis enzyme MnmG [Planctomycetota bacterium]|jgi:tRNA uridine 5-carboxymethylaminomethyl modification enzyme
MQDRYDVIVIGGGHAGAEAAWAAASVLAAHGGGRVAVITMDPGRIGQMSCNPAIGGLAKGQMVREVDALGGLMALAIDATGIMFRMLNTSKGAAVRGPRAQADKYAYAAEVQRLLSTRPAIDVIAATVDDIVVERGAAVGVLVAAGAGVVYADPARIERYLANGHRAEAVYPSRPADAERSAEARLIGARAVVLTTGTFLRGLMHTGDRQTRGGRAGEGAAVGMSAALKRMGFELGRLKTGTPPRLAAETVDLDRLRPQVGDEQPVPFSDLTPQALPARRFPRLPQGPCHITATTAEAHELIRANLHRAPMYSGQIEAECGPRYCPSIEDKVVRFPDRESHHVFLEPESLHTNEIYCNGISTSLPIDVQEQVVRMMPGCARAKVVRWGYAVEYDMIWPHQIDATLMAKSIEGLFPAGQINCTTGYEEAAGQGLVAGLNAARLALGKTPIRLRRDQAYIGVMLDDLVTKTPREPYRMFTSRAEHRLLLRADNADERLTPLGRELGVVDGRRWDGYRRRLGQLSVIRDRFDRIYVDGRTLRQHVRRPEVTVDEVSHRLGEPFDRRLVERAVTDSRYEGYIVRHRAEIRRQAKADGQRVPAWLDFRAVAGLRSEAADVLSRFRPATMGQAGRLAGVNPADLTLLAVAIRRGPNAAQPSQPEHVHRG